MQGELPVLALVVPCYNEEDIITSTCRQLITHMTKWIDLDLISDRSFITFVDDGSTDKTAALLRAKVSSMVRIVKLSRNFGHQAAMLAGMQYVASRCDACISLDADLQDDIEVVPLMIANYLGGDHIVYGVRNDRKTDGWFKRFSARAFYKLMRGMGIPIIDDHADFRLVSSRVLAELSSYHEVNLFLRGIFPMIGFQSSQVLYSRKKREGGKTKYPFWKMFRLALNGLTSFTNFPLKIITAAGMLVFMASLVAASWVFWVVVTGRNVPGWASITLPIYFLGGIQLLGVGILGEYISKIYLEAKGRPHYHIDEVIALPTMSSRLSKSPTPDFQKDLFLQKEF